MKRRKLLAAGLALGIMISGLPSGALSAGAQSGDVTVVFSTNVVGVKAEALEEACRGFEEETGYVVDFQAPGSSYEELMKTKMSANELPDVFTTHGWSVARYSDYLMPVNDMEWVADISDQVKSVITDSEGNIFVLPVDMDVSGFVYNVSVLEEAGVNPDEIRTWDDFTAACEKIKAAGKTPMHVGGKDSWTIAQIFEWIAPSFCVTNENDNQIDALKSGDFSTDTWEKIAALVDGWVKAGYFNEDCLTADYSESVAAFAGGNVGFVFYAPSISVDALAVNPDAQIGLIPIPSASADDEPSLIAGEDIAVGVWKDSKVKDEAIELLNYLARPEVMKTIAEAAANKAGLNGIDVEIGILGPYFEKYADVETYPYFDREYLPSGMWDVMAATGADILAQKDGAVAGAAETMKQNFDDKFGQ